jgi:pimeloyl-ACP methyl ester carboxylesterase
MNRRFIRIPLLVALVLSACAPSGMPRADGLYGHAATQLRQAGKLTLTDEQRAVLYLNSAREASSLLDAPASAPPARVIYNTAVADLTVLLRSARNPSLWNRPLTLTDHHTTYRLRFAPQNKPGQLDPGWFTSFTRADSVKLKTIKHRNQVDGLGGALVGVRSTHPREPFAPLVGVTAPVTAVLDFKGQDVTLALIDPTEKAISRIASKPRVLAADFSAPLAYYPQKSEMLEGLMGALKVQEHMGITGLYMLQPYDPDRIPLIFVHGLISTPRMWRNVINELATDPELRRRYQCWVFAYPTGNPPLYSAMRLRDELAMAYQLHPKAKNAVLVGHSMGGILAHAQVVDVDRQAWDVIGKDKAAALFKNIKPGSLVQRATIFRANPRVDRVVFICTPHRGSNMAVGTLGTLAIRAISLPAALVANTAESLGSSIALVTGDPHRMPTSVDGLSPRNPTHKVLDSRPITVPHHSIIGDRGKGDTPNSSDGVVAYWSSHLDSAASEKIVPGPHGACELPETIAELRRILRLQLGHR